MKSLTNTENQYQRIGVLAVTLTGDVVWKPLKLVCGNNLEMCATESLDPTGRDTWVAVGEA
jgi:hypothetical protein